MYPHQAAGAAPALALHLGETPPDGLGNIITRAGQSILKIVTVYFKLLFYLRKC